MAEEYVESRISRFLHSKASKKGIPLSGTFELTPCCNLSCRMCYVRKPMEEVSAEGGLVPAEKWIELGWAARDAGMLYLLLTGGEPLTRPDFKEIYTALRKMGLVVSINTNGTLIDEETVKFFAADPPAKINITLYGASRETYAELCGVPEAFDKTMRAIGMLKAAGITVKLNYSVTSRNCSDMKEIYRIAEEFGVHIQTACYMFPPLRRDGSMIGQNDRLPIERDAYYTLQNEIHHLSTEEFLRRAEARIARFSGTLDEQECLDAEGEKIGCRAGTTAFWVKWNGDTVPCGMLPIEGVNAFEKGFDEAWSATRKSIEAIRLPAKCKSCPDRPVCIMCAASCYCETGAFDKVPEYLCRRTRAMIAETGKQYDRIKAEKEQENES